MTGGLRTPTAKRPSIRIGARVYWQHASCFLFDLVSIIYLISLMSYFVGRIFYGEEHFLLLPWWLALILAAEATLVWETWGISVGMRVTRLRLRCIEGDRISGAQRWLYFLLLQATGTPLLGGVSSLWNRDHRSLASLFSKITLRRDEQPSAAARPWNRTSTGWATIAITLLTLIVAGYITEIRLAKLFTNASRAGLVINGLVHPDWSILGEGFGLLIETIFMSLMATLLGVLVAVPLSFFAARNLMVGFVGRTIYTAVRSVMSITRSIEPLIWGVIFVLWVRLGTFPGMLALWVHSIADLTKLYSERLESIDQGPVEAIRATGASRLQIILFGIVPQIVNPYLSFTLYRWDINVRMATIIGIVAGGGIGQQLVLYTRYWKWQQASTMMILIMATVWIIDYVSARLRARLETGAAAKKTTKGLQLAKKGTLTSRSLGNKV